MSEAMSKVLIVADVEDRDHALLRGLELASAMDLDVEVVAFAYVDIKRLRLDKDASALVKKRVLADRKAAVEAQLQKQGVQDSVKLHVVWEEKIHEWICKKVDDSYAAVVKSRHASESIGHTPTDWYLLRECEAPVLLVGKKRWKKKGVILATVDLEAKSKTKRALNEEVIICAKHYAEMFEADLHVLGVIEVPTLLADLDLVDTRTYAKKREEALQPMVIKLSDATGVPRSKFIVKRGPTAETIVSEASALKSQLVVLGTVGRTGLKAKALGNTVEKVLHYLKIDTLAIKP